MLLRRLTPLLAPLVATLWAPSAQAFERQFHVGAAGSVVFPNDHRARGYGAGVYGSYGISDVFDVRAELKSSFHEQLAQRDAFSIHTGALGALLQSRYPRVDPVHRSARGLLRAGGGLEYREDAQGVRRPLLPLESTRRLRGWVRRIRLRVLAGASPPVSSSRRISSCPTASCPPCRFRAEYRWGG